MTKATSDTTSEPPAHLGLDAFVARVARRAAVEGVIVAGSASMGRFTATSDYDLLIFLNDMRMPLRGASVYIDNRSSDILFAHIGVVDQLFAGTLTASLTMSDGGRLIRWLQAGNLLFARDDRIARAQALVRQGDWFQFPSAHDLYNACYRINFGVRQGELNLVGLASGDPIYALVFDLRLLLGIHYLFTTYFSIRRIVWWGTKEGVRYLTAHDPAFLTLLKDCIAETDRPTRMRHYRELAQLTIAPIGTLWEPQQNAVQPALEAAWDDDLVQRALAFWEELVSDAE